MRQGGLVLFAALFVRRVTCFELGTPTVLPCSRCQADTYLLTCCAQYCDELKLEANQLLLVRFQGSGLSFCDGWINVYLGQHREEFVGQVHVLDGEMIEIQSRALLDATSIQTWTPFFKVPASEDVNEWSLRSETILLISLGIVSIMLVGISYVYWKTIKNTGEKDSRKSRESFPHEIHVRKQAGVWSFLRHQARHSLNDKDLLSFITLHRARAVVVATP
ncbi:putative transmembrane protein [Toxoplasma gondii MAS]|uniref:Putative transmembrane protein n=2 Tax=Toxoplasma gondii TaxID=5811 RepID=A0A086PTE4_TOXGO|nr:putative transmembrane protein [Toxoplasma gondii MAS]PUA90873.1 putative transmembrane protein [Toxoplasma gondii TgCATBr9]